MTRCRHCVHTVHATTAVDGVPLCRSCAKKALERPVDLKVGPVLPSAALMVRV